MPYPILMAVGAGLAAAGAGAQMAAAKQSESAMNKQTKLELLRQKGYQEKSSELYDKSLAQSTPDVAKDQMAQGEQAAMQEYQKLQDIPMAAGTSPIQSNHATTVIQDKGRTQNQNRSQAKLQGYSEWDLQQAIKNLTAGQRLQMIGNQARSSANILPYEVQQASHAGDTLAGVGQILGAAGTVVGMGGALGLGAGTAGAGAGAGTAATTTAPAINTMATVGSNPWFVPAWSLGSMGANAAYFQ